MKGITGSPCNRCLESGKRPLAVVVRGFVGRLVVYLVVFPHIDTHSFRQQRARPRLRHSCLDVITHTQTRTESEREERETGRH